MSLSGIVGIVLTLVQVLAVVLASTVVFDVLHFLLHRLYASRTAWLRRVGELHEWHHRFMDRNLDVHEELILQNLRWHVIPEYLTQLSFSLCLLALLPTRVVLGAIAVQTLVFLLILRARGIDINHRPIASLRAYRPSFFCMPEYHALHHVWPDAHFSSWIKPLDHLLCAGAELAGRRLAVAGEETAFTRALVDGAKARGAVEVDALVPPAPESVDPHLVGRLRELDILVVEASGAGEDAAAWIERFAEAAAGRKRPPEVWTICMPSDAGVPAPVPATRRYWASSRVIYRHVDLSGSARLGEAAARGAARRALRGIRRGFNYVPAGGIARAVTGFLRFRLTPGDLLPSLRL